MKIYAIWNKYVDTYVRYGENGGGGVGYCLYRGMKVFFDRKDYAQSAIQKFDNPANYEIHEFTRAE